MIEALEVLAEHAVRTLPDSINERKSILRTLERVLTARHPALVSIRTQLAALKAIEKLGEELPLKFTKRQPTKDGNGGGQ